MRPAIRHELAHSLKGLQRKRLGEGIDHGVERTVGERGAQARRSRSVHRDRRHGAPRLPRGASRHRPRHRRADTTGAGSARSRPPTRRPAPGSVRRRRARRRATRRGVPWPASPKMVSSLGWEAPWRPPPRRLRISGRSGRSRGAPGFGWQMRQPRSVRTHPSPASRIIAKTCALSAKSAVATWAHAPSAGGAASPLPAGYGATSGRAALPIAAVAAVATTAATASAEWRIAEFGNVVFMAKLVSG